MKPAIILGTALALAAQGANARGPIEITPGTPYMHELTATVFPAEIGGLKLTQMQDFSNSSYDVAAIYGGINRGDEISVYLYRAGLPDVSLWFDRVAQFMVMRPQFTPANHADMTPQFFVPQGAKNASGIRMAFNTRKGDVASTGVLLMQRGDWLFKIRASSTTRPVNELNSLIDAAVAAFPLPEGTEAAPAYLPQPCSDRLELKKVKRGNEDVGSVMITLLGFSNLVSNEHTGTKPPVWCKDSSSTKERPVFRPDGRSDAYVIAFQDAGTVLAVGDLTGTLGDIDWLAAKEGGKNRPTPVVFRDSDEDIAFAIFDGTPPPQQALDLLEDWAPIGSTDRAGAINLNVPPGG